MTNRWIINRVGVVNFWYYTKQTFQLAEGRMLLRGTNGSGKSLTMQSLFPVLFDGDTSAYRLDSFGSRDRKMEDYLLGEKGVSQRDEGIGYLWLEVKRVQRNEYLTIGIGMHANRGGSLKKWFWALENNQRIDEDFQLYEEPRKNELLPLTKQKLKHRLEGTGRLFDNQRDYKAYVNERIFGFEAMDQFDELITLLLQLRSPKLSKDFRPTVIYGILQNSLPKLKEDELLPLAKTIQQLDSHREQLATLVAEIKELKRFATDYKRWQERFLRQIYGNWQRLLTDKNQESQSLSSLTKQLQETTTRLADNRQTYQQNQLTIQTLEGVVDQLSQHEGMNLVKQALELTKSMEKAKQDRAKVTDELSRKQSQLVRQRQDLEANQTQETDALAEIANYLEDNQQYLPYLRLEELDRVYGGKLMVSITSKEQDYWLQQAREKELHFRQVIEALRKISQAENQYRLGEKVVAQLQQQIDELHRDYRQWRLNRETEIENWKQALDTWRRTASFDFPNEGYDQVLYQMDNLLEEEKREELVLAPVMIAYQDAFKGEKAKQIPLEQEIQKNHQQIVALQKEIQEWRQQKMPEPVRSETRCRNREKWPADKRDYLLFYQAVDFKEDLSEEQRNQVEGALAASGILDGVITKGKLSLADDVQILPAPVLMKATLLDVLKPNHELSDENLVSVTEILESICLDTEVEENEPTVIYSDGRWKIGNLTGEMAKDYQASFIGITSQERYRKQRIAESEALIAQLEVCNGEFAESLVAIGQQLKAIEESYAKRPNGNEVYQTFVEEEKLQVALEIKNQEMASKVATNTKLHQQIMSEKTIIMQQTTADGLPLNQASYEEVATYANNYLLNLQDAFRSYQKRSHLTAMIQTLTATVAGLAEDEANLLYRGNDLLGLIAKLTRQLEENQQQQKIVNVAQLQQRLTEAMIEKERVINHQSQLIEERSQLDTTIATLEAKREQKTVILEQLVLHERNWNQLFQAEITRAGWTDEQLKTANFDPTIPLDIKEMRNLEDKLTRGYNFMADQLNNYDPKLVSVTGVSLPPEAEQAMEEFAFFNNHFEPQFQVEGQRVNVSQLMEQLQQWQLHQQDLLKESDAQLFRRVILESVGNYLRSRINQAQQWVAQMNTLLQEQKNSSGLSLSILWKGRPADGERDLSSNELVKLLQKPTELLSEADRDAIANHFQEKVRFAQEQLGRESDGQHTLYQAIETVLDYRDWFDFELRFKRANEGYNWQPLTDRRFNQFSGGEKAVAMYLPLFAAMSSRYRDAGEQCPRVITLDEAFAGIDEKNIEELFKACEQLQFNYVMNSQALFGDYATVSSLAIYELMRPQNAAFVDVISYYWDGKTKHLLLGGDEGDS